MTTGAINFFGNKFSNLNRKLSCFFNFENIGTNPNVISATLGKDKNTITGYLFPETGNFWTKKENTSFISGNYIILENLRDSSFNFKNFSYVISLEKLNYDGGVLLSSIERNSKQFLDISGNIINQYYYKGFEFGITANNYLYFEYFKNTGPEILISDKKINDKSVVYLMLNNNVINYGYMDFNNNQLENKYFNVAGEYFFDPDNLYIGYNPQAESLYSNNKNFVGYIEDIIISSPSFFDYEIKNIVSGFIYDFNSSSEYVTNVLSTGITGSYLAVTGYNTEITGWRNIATGIFTNPWGISVMGYTREPLIRQVPLNGTFYLTGEITDSITTYSGVSTNLNNNKFLAYQKNVINFLNKIDNQDLVETRCLTGFNSLVFNKKNLFIEYDRFSDSYQNVAKNENFYNIFVNGQLQKSGNSTVSTLPYENNQIFIENDFGIDPRNSNRVIFNNFYGLKGESSVFIDINTSGNLYFENVENNSGYLNITGDYDLFINGQKLINNIDYYNDITGINLNYTYSGVLIAIPKNYDFNQVNSGTPIISLDHNFYYNNTEIYRNGLRQTLDYDYFELSKYDVSTGIKILLEKNKNFIYNNEGFLK